MKPKFFEQVAIPTGANFMLFLGLLATFVGTWADSEMYGPLMALADFSLATGLLCHLAQVLGNWWDSPPLAERH